MAEPGIRGEGLLMKPWPWTREARPARARMVCFILADGVKE